MAFFPKIPEPPALETAQEVPVFMGDEDFTILVDQEIARIGAAHAGVLAVEALTLVHHFDSDEFRSAYDMAEVRAVTLLLANKYQIEALLPYCRAKTHQALWESVRQNFKPQWRSLLLEHAERLELFELEQQPLHFLIEWRDDDARLDAEKQRLLGKASFKALTEMLCLLAEREVALIDYSAPIHDKPDQHDYKLWQGISATRAMREAVALQWCAHQKTPRDYREAIAGQSAEKQWQFLKPRKAKLLKI